MRDHNYGYYNFHYVNQWSYEWSGSYLKDSYRFGPTGNFALFKTPLYQKLFANLRYLTCYLTRYSNEGTYEKLEYLNEFVKLEKLSLALGSVPRRCQTLTLPNLKCFGCSFEAILLKPKSYECRVRVLNWQYGLLKFRDRRKFKKPDCYLRLNSRVETLWLTNLEEVELCCPEQVTCLEVGLLDAKNLSELKNLRTLRCQAICKSNLNLLEHLPALEEICVKSSEQEYSEIKLLLDHLMNQKALLEREAVQIYFCDILLTRPVETYGIERFFLCVWWFGFQRN